MNKKILLPAIIAISIIAVAALWAGKNTVNPPPTGQIILFFRDACPGCQNVEAFLNENNIAEKIFFERKGIYNDKKNADELIDKARICGLSDNDIGVPFLWDGSHCFVGDVDIINFFKEKASIQ